MDITEMIMGKKMNIIEMIACEEILIDHAYEVAKINNIKLPKTKLTIMTNNDLELEIEKHLGSKGIEIYRDINVILHGTILIHEINGTFICRNLKLVMSIIYLLSLMKQANYKLIKERIAQYKKGL